MKETKGREMFQQILVENMFDDPTPETLVRRMRRGLSDWAQGCCTAAGQDDRIGLWP